MTQIQRLELKLANAEALAKDASIAAIAALKMAKKSDAFEREHHHAKALEIYNFARRKWEEWEAVRDDFNTADRAHREKTEKIMRSVLTRNHP